MTLPAQLPTAWSHLPNATHIDHVLASLQAHPDQWDAAWAAIRDKARTVARTAAWDAIRDAIRDKARDAGQTEAHAVAWDAAWTAIRPAARTAARGAAWNAARGAIAALIAWDNCAKYLTMTPDQLAVWSLLSSDPAGVLLQPYVWVLAAVATKQQLTIIPKPATVNT